MEKFRVDGELGDKDGDDDLGDGVAFLLNLVGTLDPTCVELNWVWLLRLLLTFLAFKISFIRTFSVVAIQFCDIIKH